MPALAAASFPAVPPPPGRPAARNPFEAARSHLIRRLLDLTVPAELSPRARPAQLAALADHIREAADIFDEWLAAIGGEVAETASRRLDMSVFAGAFRGAVEGNATYVAETAAYASDEEAA